MCTTMEQTFVVTIRDALEKQEIYDIIVINTVNKYKEYLRKEFPLFIINPGKKIEQSTEIQVTDDACVVINYSLFIYGLYIKKMRNVSQTPMPHVKNAITDVFKDFVEYYSADSFNFVAAGREDVDVVNLSGRPFFVELKNPKKNLFFSVPASLKENQFVKLQNLMRVNGEKIKKVIVNGERTHYKIYSAIVMCRQPMDMYDYDKVHLITGDSLADVIEKQNIGSLCAKKYKINQKTPLRVLHRRSNLNRTKEVEILAVEMFNQYLKIKIRASAGTYIKEFISGDFGRTTPSLSSLLGCWCDCVELDVVKIEVDDVPEDCIYEVMQ